MKQKHIYVAIDDTDNLESIGTGEVAEMLMDMTRQEFSARTDFVSRHQLLVHPDIPYTSHNSAMCYTAWIDYDYIEPLISKAGIELKRIAASGSDPGLCIAQEIDDQELRRKLLDYGKTAKKDILIKEDAWALASACHLHLSEHGGTGQGIIGALAGAALRMSGSDGRLKGKLRIGSINEYIEAGELASLAGHEIYPLTPGCIAPSDSIRIADDIKFILINGKPVLPVRQDPDGKGWTTCTKQQLKAF